MKKLLVVLVALAAVGCDYTVPLVKTSTMDLDRQLIGLWERTKEDNKLEQVVVLPFNAREYLVSFPAGNAESLFAKACLVKCAGKLFVQLEWIGTAQGKLPEAAQVFQFATYIVKGDELRVSLLNPSRIGKDIKSSEELVKAIEENRDDAELFREPMVYTKVTK